MSIHVVTKYDLCRERSVHAQSPDDGFSDTPASWPSERVTLAQRDKRLFHLACEINDLHESTCDKAKGALRQMGEALKDGLLLGAKLAEARSVCEAVLAAECEAMPRKVGRPGAFGKFLEKHCPKLSRSHAYNYIALAENQDFIQSLGQNYTEDNPLTLIKALRAIRERKRGALAEPGGQPEQPEAHTEKRSAALQRLHKAWAKADPETRREFCAAVLALAPVASESPAPASFAE